MLTPYRKQTNRSWAILRARQCEPAANRGDYANKLEFSIYSHAISGNSHKPRTCACVGEVHSGAASGAGALSSLAFKIDATDL